MNYSDYAFNLRNLRGSLKSVSDEIGIIYNLGSDRLKDFTLATKILGVKKTAEIASLTHEEQDKFLDWLVAKSRTKNEVDTKLLEVL